MRIIAPMMVLIMMTSTLAGCTGGDPDGEGEIDTEAINDLIEQNLQDFFNNTTMPQGPAGVDGQNGTDGQDGADGQNGTDGQDGADGQNGTDGQDGADGQNGTDGQDGIFSTTICQLVKWGYCVGANLNGMDLSGMDLTGINLRGASLQYVNLSGAILDYAVLSYTSMLNSNLEGTSLNYSDLKQANLQGAYLANSSLIRADLSSATLWTTNVYGANLNWANLEGIGMTQVVATGASFAHTNFQRSRIHGDFRNTYFWNADFRYSLIGGDFQNSTLNGIFRETICGHYEHCNFTNSVLSGDYTGFIFNSANLTDAFLHIGIDLTFASLHNAIVTNNTRFDGNNKWHYTTWIDGSVCNESPVINWGTPLGRTCDQDGYAIDI